MVTVRQRYSSSQVEVESQQQQQLGLPHVAEHTLDYIHLYRTLSSSSSHCDTSWRRNLESCLWIASAAFIVYCGDFHTNLVVLLATDSRVHRVPLNLGVTCFIMDIAILLYLVFKVHNVSKSEDKDKLVIVAPGAVPAATILGVTAFVLFCCALWPIWRFLTLPMLFTLFMALVVMVPYLAPFMNIRLDLDTLRGLYVRPSE